jgi:hypothetical protein
MHLYIFENRIVICKALNPAFIRRESLIAREKHGFTKILLDAVDDGIGFLDERGKEAMYFQVEKRYDLPRKKIPEKLEAFHKALEGLFGYGAKVIEYQIAKSLYEKLAMEFSEKDGWALTDYAQHAGEKWQQTRKVQALLSGMIPLLAALRGMLINSILWITPLPKFTF